MITANSAAFADKQIDQDMFIAQQIRRANRNLLWTNIACVALLTLVAVGQHRYFANFFLGPFPVDRTKLLSLKGGQLPFEYYLKVDYGNQKPIPLAQQLSVSIDMQSDTSQESVISEFVGVTLSDKLLVIRTEPGVRLQSPVTGALTPLPASIRKDITKELHQHDVEMDDFVVPLMLDTIDFRGSGWCGLAIGLPLCSFGIWNISRALRRIGRLENHPIARSLRTYGDPADVAAHIEREVREDASTFQVGRLLLTRSWILQGSTYGLRVVHINDVIWIHKKVTKVLANGIIPIDTMRSAMICTRDGNALEVGESDRTTDRLLVEVERRAPWVVAGFSHEMAALYEKDRTRLAAAVDERRHEMMAKIQVKVGMEKDPETVVGSESLSVRI
jgi:hypothetical protein